MKWLDSTSEPGWQYAKVGEHFDAVPPRVVVSVGILAARSPVALTLAHSVTVSSSMDASDAFMDPLTIPFGCIQKVERL